MVSTVPIAKDVVWIGVNDRETHLFESIWPLPHGVSYNSYLILDRKVALVDSVKKVAIPEFLDKLRATLGPDRKPDYLIIHHLEPDHSGALPVLFDLFPDMKVVGTKKTAEFLEHLYHRKRDVMVVGDGDELDLGSRKLQFYVTPMVHWPETMMSYLPDAKILFSGDAFGGFGALQGGCFDDAVDVDFFEDEILRYFSNIVGKYASMVQKAIVKLKHVSVSTIASTHGPVWRKDPERIIRLYDRWSRHEAEQGVVVAYASMYGNTERMAEAVIEGLSEEGLRAIRVHNVSRSHHSFILRDVWRYKGLILGSPTYDGGIFPLMGSFLKLLGDKRIANRRVGAFGSYGWSGGAVKALRESVEAASLELVEPVVEVRFAATDEQLGQCRQLGHSIARAVRNSAGC